MPVGFRSFVQGTSIVQITNEDFNFSLFLQGELSNAGWAQEGNNSGSKDVVISGYAVSDGPMLAVHSPDSAVWCELLSSSGGNLTYRVYRVGSGVVEWFFFAKKSPPDTAPGAGMRLYKKVGGVRVLTYSSMYPVVRVLGTYTDSVYSGLAIAGRKLAIVPKKQRSYSYNITTSGPINSCTQPGGSPGYQVRNEFGWQRTAVAAGVGSLSVSNRFQQVGPVPVNCSSIPVSSGGTSLSDGFSALVIDVTGY